MAKTNNRVPDYASNFANSTGNDTASFANGISGSSLLTVTPGGTRVDYRIRYLTAHQVGDIFQFQVKNASGYWINLNNDMASAGIMPLIYQNGTFYGAGFKAVVNTTDVDVSFGKYPANSADYGLASTFTWLSIAAIFPAWRLIRVSNL